MMDSLYSIYLASFEWALTARAGGEQCSWIDNLPITEQMLPSHWSIPGRCSTLIGRHCSPPALSCSHGSDHGLPEIWTLLPLRVASANQRPVSRSCDYSQPIRDQRSELSQSLPLGSFLITRDGPRAYNYKPPYSRITFRQAFWD